MSSSNNNQVIKLFPGLEKIMQGHTGSSNSEASVYGHTQPAGSSPRTIQECILSLVSSIMALFAHHTQAAANTDCVSTLAFRIRQVSHGVTFRIDNPLPLETWAQGQDLNPEPQLLWAVSPMNQGPTHPRFSEIEPLQTGVPAKS
ncbi:hypothetical protein DSO57_1002700 [Entomophthora muscae]|uniref:Uncharacterized protein n=1 Tax=Entomophthora muscae TaxID=34485 RepID=A0ACC2UHR0_9FUNG|nr:hypothetical protein DSO57_1002700 [Entomophthora muscae]